MLTFFAPMNTLGYGVHAYGLMEALHRKGIPLALFTPSGQIGIPMDTLIEQWIKNQQRSKATDPAVMIYHEPFLRGFSGRPRIGFPVFEMEVMSDRDRATVGSCDILLQPSKWGVEVLNENGLIGVPKHVVPEGYDPETFMPERSDREMLRMMTDTLSFAHVGKMEARKSTREIVKAFTTAVFITNRKAELHLHIFDPFDQNWGPRFAEYLRELGYEYHAMQREQDGAMPRQQWKKGSAWLSVYTERFNSQSDVATLYNRSHFGIWASKAEGWNLPLTEAIACGLPSFTTGWTGQSEYVIEGEYPEELLFKKNQQVVANDGRWFRGDRGMWRCPVVDEMTEKLAVVMANAETLYPQLRAKTIELRKGLTWDHSALALLQALKTEGVDV